ncbi:DUF3105 domain-containing protein [Paeniglutamicibacter sp. NPDC012692]|uniref:DUF3105 domain-containing protein n=1 Tax=Paeniglutamicibacter sp. NPDC012692 TaxID=3364388 RepID=UPI0036BB0E0F
MNKREEAQAVLAKAKAKEKRTKILTISIAAAAILAIAVPTAVVLSGAAQKKAEVQSAAKAPIDGVQNYTIGTVQHTQNPVTYPQKPGVGGDHFPVWKNCGIYTEPVQETAAVHSLEHGAVWITYDGISDADVKALNEVVGDRTYMLLSPFPGQGAKIKLSAWGEQLSVDSPTDPRIATFITKYRQGPQTPEPGAACTGGI